ncbi:MAG: TlyA family RNA methyltransferase, partial [Candidatus Nanopelagicales bacterium]
MTRRRLDAELVRRGLARSREQAQQLIADGRVLVAGATASKPATQVDGAAALVVAESAAGPDYVSRGAQKLIGALDALDPDGHMVVGRRALDAGASTGGFTEVLLRRGAANVVAVDVGYGQLAWSLRGDPRVTVMDRTNVRSLGPGDLPYRPDLIVADLSFISLRMLVDVFAALAAPGADLLLMVKPQFEVGRQALGSGGVVRDPVQREAAVLEVAKSAWVVGLGTAGVVASPLPGPSGNVEYFLHLRDDAGPPDPELVHRAVEEGP